MLREMLKRHEGLRLKPYRDTQGYLTIGYGWNLDANPLPADYAACLRVTGAITEAMADHLLTISIDTAERNCKAMFPKFHEFSEVRKAALIDFFFNLGIGKVLTFKKALAAILDGDWDRAADEMQDSLWFSQVGDRGPEIVGMVRTG